MCQNLARVQCWSPNKSLHKYLIVDKEHIDNAQWLKCQQTGPGYISHTLTKAFIHTATVIEITLLVIDEKYGMHVCRTLLVNRWLTLLFLELRMSVRVWELCPLELLTVSSLCALPTKPVAKVNSPWCKGVFAVILAVQLWPYGWCLCYL